MVTVSVEKNNVSIPTAIQFPAFASQPVVSYFSQLRKSVGLKVSEQTILYVEFEDIDSELSRDAFKNYLFVSLYFVSNY